MTTKEINEGDKCPECHTGNMHFPKVENCSCHVNPPCSACTSNKLTCDDCGWEFDPPAPETSYRIAAPGLTEVYTRNPSVELGGGKRIFDFDYNGASGSTMEINGRCTPEVTEADILKYFSSGTFGHRGPVIHGGRFFFTKITD